MKYPTRMELGLFLIPLSIVPFYWVVGKVRPGPEPPPAPRPTSTARPLLLTARSSEWRSIVPSRDGRKLITGSFISSPQYSVQVWDAKTLQLEGSFGVQPGEKRSPLALTPDGKSLVLGWGGDNGKFALIYDVASGQQRLQLPSGTGTTEFAVSPDSKLLALGQSQTLDLRDLKTGRVIRRLRRWLPAPSAKWAQSPAFSPDGKYLAFVDSLPNSQKAYASDRGDEIGFFSVKTGRRLWTLGWKHTNICDIEFSPDGRLLAVLTWTMDWRGTALVDQTNQVLLCEARTGRVLRSLPTKWQMHVLAFSPDSRWIASGSLVNGIQVWDAHTGQLHIDQPLDPRGFGGDMVYSISFTRDSQTLLVGSNKVRLVTLNPKPHQAK